jgi:branched-chain amino acid transport system permease protein
MMRKQKKNIISMGLILALYLILNTMLETGIINRYYGGIIQLSCINIILALSLNLITGFTGQLSLGHAGFMSIGAYTSAVLTAKLDVPFLPALIIAGVFTALVSLIIGIPTLKLSGDYFAITTLGFGEIIRVALVNIDYVGGPRGFTGIPLETNFTWVFAITVLVAIAIRNLIHSAPGRAMLSVRENEIAAEAMGVDTVRYKIYSFMIAALIAGVAGGLYAHYIGYLKPEGFAFVRSIEILTYAVLGGLGSITGSILGAVFLTFLPELLRSVSDFRMIIYSAILIILMIFRPQGFMGSKELSFRIFRDSFKGFPVKKDGREKNS